MVPLNSAICRLEAIIRARYSIIVRGTAASTQTLDRSEDDWGYDDGEGESSLAIE